MKYFLMALVVIGACCAVALTEEIPEEVKEHIKTCMEKNNLTQDEVMDVFLGKTAVTDVSDNMKCSMKCFLEKGGFMDAAGKFNPEAMKAKVNGDEQKIKAIEKCKDLKGANPCDTAFVIFNCLIEEKFGEKN